MSKMLKIQYTECNALNSTHVEDIKNTCIVVSCANACIQTILVNLAILHLNWMKYIHWSWHCSCSLLYQQLDAI